MIRPKRIPDPIHAKRAVDRSIQRKHVEAHRTFLPSWVSGKKGGGGKNQPAALVVVYRACRASKRGMPAQPNLDEDKAFDLAHHKVYFAMSRTKIASNEVESGSTKPRERVTFGSLA